jgi:hypothetical protein
MCCREGYGNMGMGCDAKCRHQEIYFAVRTAYEQSVIQHAFKSDHLLNVINVFG